jgi:hypothetical protein
MKECKCSKILPCYTDGYGVLHYLDDTHAKVYGVNKQMCDLERGLSNDFLDMQVRIADKLAKDVIEGVRTPDWAKNMLAGIPEQLSRAEYEILDEILKEKNRFMEEKKTRKMTKAEAFEYLKGKKVLCYSSKMEVVQGFVKSLGFHWSDYSEEPMLVSILFLGEDGRLTYSVSLKRFEEHESPEISADDILSIEIVDENKSEEEKALDKISCLGAQIVDILLHMKGHHHVTITETTVALYDEGMCLFHSDPF